LCEPQRLFEDIVLNFPKVYFTVNNLFYPINVISIIRKQYLLMQNFTHSKAAILGLSIGLGILFSGIFIGNGFYKSRMANRFVTVKGLAEKEVDADQAIWPITFIEAGQDLLALQTKVDFQRETVTQFLLEKGFQKEDISHSAPKITDSYAELYNNNQQGPRFRIQKTITLRSSNVKLIKETMELSGELVAKGIVLSESWENRTEFLFTSLNTVKPEMIREATLNAREAAVKFAEDSGSKIGKIRSATQGFFSISDRDANTPDKKVVRVVTTIEFFLTDN
jgi:hypothetical protein